MARIRSVKPEFFDSPSTAQASFPARLLFVAMWCWADDYGIGTANMKELAAFAFPNDEDITSTELPSLCKEVADAFGVVFYSVRGRPFYSIPTWDTHQRTERRAKRRNPAPEHPEAAPDLRFCQNLGTSDTTHGSSAWTDGCSGIGTGEQGNRGTGEQEEHSPADDEDEQAALPIVTPNGATVHPPSPPGKSLDEQWANFWAAYPRKVGKDAARKVWDKRRKDAPPDVITAGALRLRGDPNLPEPQFIPHPATWLTRGGWTDDPYPPQRASNGVPDRVNIPRTGDVDFLSDRNPHGNATDERGTR